MQKYLYTPLIACLLLSGCGEGSVSERLGMERKAPDEFRVVSRPPLSVPPEFNLRAPTDGSEGGLQSPVSRQAQEVVFGTNIQTQLQPGSAETAVMPVISSEAPQPTDQNFLTRAGVAQANPEIRQIIRAENGETGYEEEKSVLEKLREPSKNEPVVNAVKESDRIKQNEDAGKAINDGDVETKKPKDRGILDKFDTLF